MKPGRTGNWIDLLPGLSFEKSVQPAKWSGRGEPSDRERNMPIYNTRLQTWYLSMFMYSTVDSVHRSDYVSASHHENIFRKKRIHIRHQTGSFPLVSVDFRNI